MMCFEKRRGEKRGEEQRMLMDEKKKRGKGDRGKRRRESREGDGWTDRVLQREKNIFL